MPDEKRLMPPQALKKIKEIQGTLKTYLDGIMAGMGIEGDWNVDLGTGELTQVVKEEGKQ
ncbi:hypothetical protein LCGC14_0637660 [marine sediment metagenome]|uniref:Uncharacterized protein n=1 Tax=marine sediment metagenome TaxID=412755 RepID=A0A0F9R052_9ZZZZ